LEEGSRNSDGCGFLDALQIFAMCLVITIIPGSTVLFGNLKPYNADMKRFRR
jgi:hypothetical protein